MEKGVNYPIHNVNGEGNNLSTTPGTISIYRAEHEIMIQDTYQLLQRVHHLIHYTLYVMPQSINKLVNA